MKTQTMTAAPQMKEENTFRCPECRFAAVCGECYYNRGGRCEKHGGWVDYDKWACPDFA